jgi:hypothetical protein
MFICLNQLCLLGLASYLPLILADNATTLDHSVDFRVGFHVSNKVSWMAMDKIHYQISLLYSILIYVLISLLRCSCLGFYYPKQLQRSNEIKT